MMTGPAKVVVLGGGFGGLEAAFYLRMRLQEKADLTLISDTDHFLFKPNTIYIPFGLDPKKLKIGLQKPLKQKNIQFIQSSVREVEPQKKRIRVADSKIPYDYLVIATGAGMRPKEIPGLEEYAETIWTPEAMLSLREAYQKLLRELQENKTMRVLFTVPPNNKCAGPLYEMVLMLDTWLRRKGARNKAEIIWTTYEGSYIQAFGPRLHEVVKEEFAQRGIRGFTGYPAAAVDPKQVTYQNGEVVPYDLLVSFPPYIAAHAFPGLPSDDRGFIQTESTTRQVAGYLEIYAIGDAGNFPVKQAFLAFLQADAAADHLASQILHTAPSSAFNPISMCVMEQFDKATFAQVPLRLTGVAAKPVEVAPDLAGLYKVGSSPVWRLGKKLLGVYLPWRFNAGNPFHAGLPWKGMEFGLKVMSSLLAS